MKNMLNPVWLKTFVTLIDTGHFTKTAEKLFMTQPGVSQHISKLEQACGFSLIKRNKKNFDITEQGRMVYEYAGNLAKNETALFEQLAFDNPIGGVCSIASSGSLALNLFPKLLNLQIQHEALLINLKAAPQKQILDEIKSDIVDLGIVTEIPNKSIFDVKQLGQEELCLVFNKQQDITQHMSELINQVGLIDHPDAYHYLSLFLDQCQEPDAHNINIGDINKVGFINQISQILEPIARGIGFTVLPRSAIESFHNKSKLTIFTPKHPVIETLFSVKKKNRELPARYKLVVNTLEEVTSC